MSKRKTRRKLNPIIYKILSFILIIVSVCVSGYLIYNEILPSDLMIKIVLGEVLVLYVIAFVLNSNKIRSWLKNVVSVFSILLLIIEAILFIYGSEAFNFLSNITDNGYRITLYDVYVLKSSSYKKINDLKGKELEYISTDDDKDIEYILDKVKKDVNLELNYTDSFDNLVNDLIENNTDSIIMESSYEDILRDDNPELLDKIKKIKTYKKEEKVEVIKSNKDITKDSFLIYISGIDTSGNVQSKARSDVNLLLAVNPKTAQILMVNTPRDYYVALNNNGKKDKLTHAGIYGVEESMNTLGDLYDTKIDFYARVNFTSFIKIVDALEGVTINVPISFCEQNSKRSTAEGDLVCLKKGVSTLNGEQALAYARNRHNFAEGDRARGNHQMEILEAMIKKALSPKVITKFSSILNALDGKVTTNMTDDDIKSFIRKQIKHTDDWKFTSMSVSGKDSSGICYSTGAGRAYVMEPNMDDVYNVRGAIKDLINGKKEITTTKKTSTTTTKVVQKAN